MKEITRIEADELIKAAMSGPKQPVTMCYSGKWYDIRGLSSEEISRNISRLTRISVDELPGRTMDINIGELVKNHAIGGAPA